MYAVPVAQPVTTHKKPSTALQAVVSVGKANGLKPWWQTVLLSWHGGCFIAFGAGVGLALAGTLDTVNLTGNWTNSDGSISPVNLHLSVPVAAIRFAIGATFSFALNCIVLSGAELFTGNVMFATASRWAGEMSWLHYFKNLVLSLLGNISGALTVAYFLFHLTTLYETESIKQLVFANAEKLVFEGTFGENVLKGVGDNYLIGLALWGASAADDVLSKIVAIWWPVMAFVCIGFEHSIATSFFVPIAIMNGAPITVNQYIGRCLVPVAIGNVIGGAIFATVQFWMYRPADPTESKETWLAVMLSGIQKNNYTKPSEASADVSRATPESAEEVV